MPTYVCQADRDIQRLYRNIDVQKFFLLLSTSQILYCRYRSSVCIMHYFDQSATNQLDNVFLIGGVGFCRFWFQIQDFMGGETRAYGVSIHEEQKKVQNKNLHKYSNIYTPYSIRLTLVGVEGVCFLADCLRCTQKWPVGPVVGSSFGWLIYLWTFMFLYCLWYTRSVSYLWRWWCPRRRPCRGWPPPPGRPRCRRRRMPPGWSNLPPPPANQSAAATSRQTARCQEHAHLRLAPWNQEVKVF